jgi:hypothetical protein
LAERKKKQLMMNLFLWLNKNEEVYKKKELITLRENKLSWIVGLTDARKR